MATHSSTLAWRILWIEESDGLICGVAKSSTKLSMCVRAHTHTHTHTHPYLKGETENNTIRVENFYTPLLAIHGSSG